MSKPYSTRTQPWAGFEKQSYSIFTDDFVHEKLLTVKVNQKSTRGTVNLKGQVAKKGDTFASSGQIKLWFPLWNTRSGQLYFRSKQDQIKVLYDDGLKQIVNGTFNNYNLYASYQSNKHFENIVFKAGVNLLSKNFNFDNRVRVHLAKSGLEVSTGHKFSWVKNNWSLDMYDILCFKNTAKLINNAVRIGFRSGDNDFFLRGQNQTHRQFKNANYANIKTYFNRFTFDYVRTVDSLTKFGIETQFTTEALGRSSLVFQRSIPSKQAGVKAKVSTDKRIALCYQSVISNYGKWTVGWELSDLGQSNRSSYGVQFDLNL